MNRKRCKFTKIIAAILIAVMICGNAGVEGFGKKITAKAATPIERTLNWNTEHTGNLDNNEKDVYVFSLKRSGKVNIQLTTEGYVYYCAEISIYDASDERIKYYEIEKGSYNYSFELLAGSYKLVIDSVDNEYSFVPKFTPSGETKQESYMAKNNSTATGTYYTLGKKVRGQLAMNDAMDIYKLNITKPGYVTIAISSYLNDYDISVINEYQNDPVYSVTELGAGSYKKSLFARKGIHYFIIQKDSYNTDSKYCGSYTFTITNTGIPTSRISKVTNSSRKAATVRWNTSSRVDGYQIQYSVTNTYKKGYTKTVMIRKKATAATVLRNLRKGATYYVRIRTFKRDSFDVAQWSAWSSSAKIRITK